MGIFARRAPVRPNPVAVTGVRLIRREGARLIVRGLDAVNGTPVIDIKNVLDGLAEREGVDRAAVCIAFVLAHPSAPVAILGTQTPARLAAATAALAVTLDRGDVYAIVQASEGVPLP